MDEQCTSLLAQRQLIAAGATMDKVKLGIECHPSADAAVRQSCRAGLAAARRIPSQSIGAIRDKEAAASLAYIQRTLRDVRFGFSPT
jgi:hypothetical protein